MGVVEQCVGKGGISWKISSKDKGTITSLQDLGGDLGINLKRVNPKGIKGRHAVVDFGFGTMYESWPHSKHLVDTRPCVSVEVMLMGMVKLKCEASQIAVHKAGAHARIIVPESGIKVKSGKL